LRSVISALENAGSVPVASAGLPPGGEHVAGAVRFGEAESEARVLTGEEVDQILADEIAMRLQQADVLDQAHRDLEAAMARYQATLITRLVDGDLTPSS